MKRISKSVLLITLLVAMTIPAWGQASTQGVEFWVSSTLACSPKDKEAEPYIAISAEEACTVTITGGASGTLNITQEVAAGSWNEFGHNSKTEQRNPYAGLVYVNLDPKEWYPISIRDGSKVSTLAGQKKQYGLHITATKKISVYVIVRAEASMDASNILPITAIGSEYYLQDYVPEAHNEESAWSLAGHVTTLTTILATEDGTKVTIKPTSTPFGRTNADPFDVDLNKGEVYYLVSKEGEQLAGTHIQANDDRKIAIYTGLATTRLPNGVSARDCLFEQSMPVEYWGTQFIVTRSLRKNGNLIGITATQRGTEIKVDGYTQTYIDEGETYYIMLQGPNNPNAKKPGTGPIDQVITGDALYIETSCPCAVYNYDTGQSYENTNGEYKDLSELTDATYKGDPSSVWVSPIQQKIGKITFGTCGTDLTHDHFLNIITETDSCKNTTLTALYGVNRLDKTSLLTWTPVPGNPTYSYARAQIGDINTTQYSVFQVENSKGFIATVYGHGKAESYAYSAGSAAVEQGVIMDGETFTNGIRSDTKFCIGTEFVFDSRVGTDEVTRVDWDFGDGITEYNGEPVTTHTYTTPGWYDAKAKLFGHQACADESEQDLGTVSFTFRVWQHDTIIVPPSQDDKICFDTLQIEQFIQEEKMDSIMALIANGNRQIINPDAPCYEDRKISLVPYGMDTKYEYTPTPGHDSIYVNRKWYYPETLPEDGIIKWEEDNHYGCDSFITCHAKIITCLDLAIKQEPQHACLGDNTLTISYTKTKGDIEGNAVFTIDELPSFREEIVIDNKNIQDGKIYLPIANLTEPGYYHATITVKDSYCTEKVEENTFRIPLTVYYPQNIFKIKFGNTLAVYAPGNEGNKGYTFTGFQWYRNGEAILGATNAVYTSETQFEKGDEYYVMLTNDRNETLPSCAQTIEGNGQASAPNKAPAAQKKIVNQRIRIVIDNRVYDMYGQRVE